MSTTTIASALLEWIAAARIERNAFHAWQRALPLTPIRRGPDQHGQVWFGHVEHLRVQHAAARATLNALTPSR